MDISFVYNHFQSIITYQSFIFPCVDPASPWQTGSCSWLNHERSSLDRWTPGPWNASKVARNPWAAFTGDEAASKTFKLSFGCCFYAPKKTPWRLFFWESIEGRCSFSHSYLQRCLLKFHIISEAGKHLFSSVVQGTPTVPIACHQCVSQHTESSRGSASVCWRHGEDAQGREGDGVMMGPSSRLVDNGLGTI